MQRWADAIRSDRLASIPIRDFPLQSDAIQNDAMYARMPASSISIAIAVRISPISRSKAVMTAGPSTRCSRSADSSTTSYTTATSISAAT